VALNIPGDEDLLGIPYPVAVELVVAEYRHPETLCCLQFMGEASCLRTTLNGFLYRALIAPVRMHNENARLPGVDILTPGIAMYEPTVWQDVANAVTGGDTKKLVDELNRLQSQLRVRYDGGA